MGGDVDAKGQTADDDRRHGEPRGKRGDDVVDTVDAVGGCVARADNGDDRRVVEPAVAEGVEHHGRIVTLGKSRRVVIVGEIEGTDVARDHKINLAAGILEQAVAVAPVENPRRVAEKRAQLPLGHFKKRRLIAHARQHLARHRGIEAPQRRKRDAIDQAAGVHRAVHHC